MKKILVIAYYYPPCRGVASFRPQSWTNDFPKHGFSPTVITRHWNGNENVWTDYLKDLIIDEKITVGENSTTINLPFKRNKYLVFAEKKWVRKIYLDKFIYLLSALTGNFQLDVDGYNCFKEYVFKHLESNKYKLVIVTSPPLNIIKLAFKINKKYQIPFIVDFQDSWNNEMLIDNYNPGLKEKFYNFLKEFYLKKWLSPVLFTTTVTPAISNFVKKVSNKPCEIITNGFDKESYALNKTMPSDLFFNVSVMGTVHPMQDISIMLNGLILFLKDKDPQKVKLNFIGIDAVPEMANKVKNIIPHSFLYTSSRVSMEESVNLTLAANVLLFPSYKGYKGYYTAKIFEYLGARKNILMVPGNNDIVDELILKTQSGKIANSGYEFSEILNNWYKEWQSKGTLKFNGINENIEFYSRENQNQIFCELVNKMI